MQLFTNFGTNLRLGLTEQTKSAFLMWYSRLVRINVDLDEHNGVGVVGTIPTNHYTKVTHKPLFKYALQWYKENFWTVRLMGDSFKYCMVPIVWEQKLNKLDDNKIFLILKGGIVI